MEHRRVGELRAAAGFMILMAGLGVSDSLRGIFAPVFQQHFTLNASGLSVIIMVSYLGNLVFLSLGGQMMDRFDRKKTTMAVLLLWMAALVVYVVSDHFLLLLVSVFFAMGASTLLNTTVNLLTPLSLPRLRGCWSMCSSSCKGWEPAPARTWWGGWRTATACSGA